MRGASPGYWFHSNRDPVPRAEISLIALLSPEVSLDLDQSKIFLRREGPKGNSGSRSSDRFLVVMVLDGSRSRCCGYDFLLVGCEVSVTATSRPDRALLKSLPLDCCFFGLAGA